MLYSIAILFIFGALLANLFKRLGLPSLVGMLIAGILLGPSVLNLLDGQLLDVSTDLRRIALVIILLRAGLAINLSDLRKVGRPAVLMSFVPATFEMVGVIIFAPMLLGVSYLEAAIMGAVLGAVSPAVIVPKMLDMMRKGEGTKKGIPQMIMASASFDDLYLITFFSVFLSLSTGDAVTAMSFGRLPISIVMGIVIGASVGYLFNLLYKKFEARTTIKLLTILSVSFLLLTAEDYLGSKMPFSALLAIMVIGIVLLQKNATVAKSLSSQLSSLWIGAEIILFVLIGASLDLGYAVAAGANTIILILIVLCIRMIGVYMSLIKTEFTTKERLFCMLAYIPKATVQAAIGGIPLAMGLSCGNAVLTLAVISILITAPLGAFAIDWGRKKLLIDKVIAER
ncbi:MAG: cation:proton antiporter [bacterium]